MLFDSDKVCIKSTGSSYLNITKIAIKDAALGHLQDKILNINLKVVINNLRITGWLEKLDSLLICMYPRRPVPFTISTKETIQKTTCCNLHCSSIDSKWVSITNPSSFIQ